MVKQNKRIFTINGFFATISVILCVLLYVFSKSCGFVANVFDMHDNSIIVYSKDLMSSGSDDNAIIGAMIFFRILFIFISLFNLKKPCLKFFIIPFFLDILFLCLVSDTSNISRTISNNSEFRFWLLTWIISFCGCIFVLIKFDGDDYFT